MNIFLGCTNVKIPLRPPNRQQASCYNLLLQPIRYIEQPRRKLVNFSGAKMTHPKVPPEQTP